MMDADNKKGGPYISRTEIFSSPRVGLLIVAAGLVVRLAIIIFIRGEPFISDAEDYDQMAYNLLSGRDFIPWFPPLVPIHLALFYRIFGSGFLIGRASMLVYYLALCFGLRRISRTFMGETTSNLALFIFAFYPSFIYYSITPLTQLPTGALLLISLYLGTRAIQKPSVLSWTLLGLFLGLLSLARPSSLILTAALPIGAAYLSGRTWSAGIAALISFALIFTWCMKASEVSGYFTFINKYNNVNFFRGNNPYTPLYKTWIFGSRTDRLAPEGYRRMVKSIRAFPSEEEEKQYAKHALSHIFGRPDLFLVRTANRARAFFAMDTFLGGFLIKSKGAGKTFGFSLILLDNVFYFFIACFSILAFLGPPREEEGYNYLKILGLISIFLYAAPYWISFSHPTYHAPITPILALFACDMLARAAKANGATFRQKLTSLLPAGRKKRIAALLLLLLFVYIQVEWVYIMADRI